MRPPTSLKAPAKPKGGRRGGAQTRGTTVTAENKARALSAGRLPASAPRRRSSAIADRTCPAAPLAFCVHRRRPPQFRRRCPRRWTSPSTSPPSGMSSTAGFVRTSPKTRLPLHDAISGDGTYPPSPPAPTMSPDTSRTHLRSTSKALRRVDQQGTRPSLSRLKVDVGCMHNRPG